MQSQMRSARIYDYVAERVFGEFALTNKAMGLLGRTVPPSNTTLTDQARLLRHKRRAAGETLASIAKSYAVDLSMISRL
jgi:hypothetical protein